MTVTSQNSFYELLGVEPTATPEDIKKRYRELARRYHPDINSSPDAAQKIKRINEAYHILGDVDRRSSYDAERLLSQRPTEPANGGRSTTSAGQGNASYNGFGRSSSASSYAPQRPVQNTIAEDKSFGQVDRLLKEAQLAYVNRRYREVENCCGQILLIEKENATAHELLGDVCVRRGKLESAAVHYSYAVQFNPRNYVAQSKLERLIGKESGVTFNSPTMKLSDRSGEGWRPPARLNKEVNTGGLSIILCTLFFLMLGLLAAFPGDTFKNDLSLLSDLSLNLLGALVINGVIAGILLAFFGTMRPITEELLSRNVDPERRNTPISLGVLLVLFSLVSFYLSLTVYLFIALVKSRFSRSIFRVYAMVLLLAGAFALAYQPANAHSSEMQVFLFGGNLLFPTALLGWAIGDAIRLRGR